LSVVADIAIATAYWVEPVLVVALIGIAVVAIIGGSFAIARKSYPMALVGAVFSLIGPGFFLGIPGLILIAMSKNEFT